MAPCLSSIRAERLRFSRLAGSGAPLAGPTNGYVSDAQVSIDVGLEIEEGDEIIQKNGGGRLCASFKDVNRVKNATLDIELCQLDVELLALATGGTVIGDPPSGFMPPSGQQSLENPVCVETWTRAWDGGSQATLPDGTTPAYWHFVFPNVKFTPGEFTLDENTHIFPISGTSQENQAITPNGPFNDWPAGVQTVGGITRVYGVFLDDEPPDTQCGGIAVPAQPEQAAATGANAGTPGTWTPPGAPAPTTVANLISGTPEDVTATPGTAWTTGQYVQTQAAGTGGRAYWNGTAWVAGSAP
jgi:hypothetical protein